MSKSWPLPDDVECPECGEDEHIMGEITEEHRYADSETGEIQTEVLEAELTCGVGLVDHEIVGCLHTWTWRAEE